MPRKKRTHRRLTDHDKARIAVVLQANDGNIKGTARELGLAPATVRWYRDKWEREGMPKQIEDRVPAIRNDFAKFAEDLRWELYEALAEKAQQRDLSGRDLIQGIAMLTDKINILTGKATTRTEHVETKADSEAIAKNLADFLAKSADLAKERSDAIESSQEQGNKATLTVIQGEKS